VIEQVGMKLSIQNMDTHRILWSSYDTMTTNSPSLFRGFKSQADNTASRRYLIGVNG
jgi:hypothetical protein